MREGVGGPKIKDMSIAQEKKSVASDFDVVAIESCMLKTDTVSRPNEECDVGRLAESRRWKCERVS